MTGASLLPAMLLLLAGPETGKLRESVKADEARLRDSPDDADALKRLAVATSRSRSRTRRCRRSASWSAADPARPPSSSVRALRLAGEAAEAKGLLDQAITQSPSDPALHMERALLARSLDDNEGAIRVWTRVTDLRTAGRYCLVQPRRVAPSRRAPGRRHRRRPQGPGADPKPHRGPVDLREGAGEEGAHRRGQGAPDGRGPGGAARPRHPLQPRGAAAARGQRARGHRRLRADAPARPPLGRGAQQPRGGARLEGRLRGRPPRASSPPPATTRAPPRPLVQPRPLLLPHRRQREGEPGLRPGADHQPQRQRALHPARAAT